MSDSERETSGADSPDSPEERRRREPDHWLEPIFSDSTLWPLLLVMLLILVTLGAALLLLALADRNLFAMAALAVVAIVSVDVCRHDLGSAGWAGSRGRSWRSGRSR